MDQMTNNNQNEYGMNQPPYTGQQPDGMYGGYAQNPGQAQDAPPQQPLYQQPYGQPSGGQWQGGQQQPYAPPQQPHPAKPARGMSVASMVCGICAVVFLAWLPLSIPCAIVALVLGIIAKNKNGRDGMAVAGIVLGAVAVFLGVVVAGIIAASCSAVTAPYWDAYSWEDFLDNNFYWN